MPTPFFNTDCFTNTRHAAIDPSGRVIVSDYANRMVWVIGADGYSTSLIDSEFSFPEGVAVDRQGRIIVADRLNHRVKVFSTELEEVLEFGKKGISTGRFNEPAGIAIGRDDTILVADSNNDRIQVFSRDGEFIRAFGETGSTEGEFRGPVAIATDANDRIYVAEYAGQRIQVFDADGAVVRTIGGLKAPQGVAVDDDGNIYITESGDRASHYRIIGLAGQSYHHPLEHHPVGITTRDGKVFVCTGPRITVQERARERPVLQRTLSLAPAECVAEL
jgi:DNA-binding beta-propeller fold protein YncE